MTSTDWASLLGSAIDAGQYGFLLLDGNGRLLFANRAAGELLHRPEQELQGATLASLIHPDDRGWVETELELLLAGAIYRLRYETRFIAADGQALWSELNARSVDIDQRIRAVVMFEDAGDRFLREHELRRLADTDPLTDLFNRRRFATEFDHHLTRAKRYGARGALVVLDIDGLKGINDAHGHAAGDRVIVLTAEVLRARVRASDVVGRLGGDEFALLLPAAGEDEATAIADSLLEMMRARSAAEGVEASLSIGVASVRAGADATSLFGSADSALYDAKRRGGNAYAVADPERAGRASGEDATVPAGRGGARKRRRAASGGAGEGHVDLGLLLATVKELGNASLGLLAWELGVAREAVAEIWSAAIREGMLRPAGYDAFDHEWQYELTSDGEVHLRAERPAGEATEVPDANHPGPG